MATDYIVAIARALKEFQTGLSIPANATPQQCYNFITDLVQDNRAWVINNPNSHLNDIVLP